MLKNRGSTVRGETELATMKIVFLGILLDGDSMTLGIPTEKRRKAISMLQMLKDKRKATVLSLQRLSGFFFLFLDRVGSQINYGLS